MVLCVLFRPSFCAHCGDKIERSECGLFTSRRVCEVCESEYKAHDLLPRIVAVLCILAGVFGFLSFLRNGSPVAGSETNRQPRRLAEMAAGNIRSPTPNSESASNVRLYGEGTIAKAPVTRMAMQRPADDAAMPAQQLKDREVAAEAVYVCGAETKKGTPCSRRVKGNVRCFQHTGMPAMLPADKLKISQ